MNDLTRLRASVQCESVGVDESLSRCGTLPKVDTPASRSVDKNADCVANLMVHAVKDFGLVVLPNTNVFGQKMWISRGESGTPVGRCFGEEFKLPAASAIA